MDKHLLLDIPDALESEQLIIRAPHPGDGPEFNAAICATLPQLQRWLGIYSSGPPTVEETEIFVRQQHARFLGRQELMLLLQLKNSSTIVGASGLHPRNWEVPRFEIGYWARTDFAGQGYVTEAVSAITQFAFKTLRAERVEIHCDKDNIRSAAVARRAGFEFEAWLRHNRRNHENTLTDELIFSRIRA
jgi:RimJ/RimL family protein N-acetyltransferase